MGLDLVELWNNMSIIVKVITVLMIGMSVFMFYIIAERLLTYRAASDQSIRYVQALGEYLRQHKVNEALNTARSMPKSPVAKVMESGLDALIKGQIALKTEDGAEHKSSVAILCTGHNAPDDPYALSGHPNFFRNPYGTFALPDREGVRVGILGSGLTAVQTGAALPFTMNGW